MKKSMLSVILAVLFTVSMQKAQAQTTPSEEHPWNAHVALSTAFTSNYLAFGTGVVLSKYPTEQTNLNLAFNNGLYLDMWNSRSTKGPWGNNSLGNEIDYGIGWKGSITKHLTLDVGTAIFDEPKTFTFGAGDIIYNHAFLTRDFPSLSITAGFENYVTLPGSGFQGANLFSLTAGKNWSFYNDHVGVHASVAAVYDSGGLGAQPGFLLRGTAGVDWKLTKHFTINVINANWFLPEASTGIRSNMMASSGVTIFF